MALAAELWAHDPAALDRFLDQLVAAGFEPHEGSEGREWEGPIDPSFAPLTGETTMRIIMRDGWPFRSPRVIVRGLATTHSSRDIVCLWREDDGSREWMTLEGIRSRIAEWCRRAISGFGPEDFVLDAYLAFEKLDTSLGIFDLTELREGTFTDGQSGALYGTATEWRNVIEIGWSGQTPEGALRGQWYYRENVPLPPSDLDAFRATLARGQQRNFDRGLRRLADGDQRGFELVVLIVKRDGHLDVSMVRCTRREDGSVASAAIQPAPNDMATLIRRAGPDAAMLQERHVVSFGAGAIGSHAALLVAEAGTGTLTLVDGDKLRPGNVVRHVGGKELVGLNKTYCVRHVITGHAPWTNIRLEHYSPLDPKSLSDLLEGQDVALDTTGIAPVTEAISRMAELEGVALVSAALYRGGRIARVRRQAPNRDIPIYRRSADDRFTKIPPGDDEPEGLEIGCSSPVVNAPPASVVSAATLTAQVVVDLLSGRFEWPSEIIQVLRPIPGSDFDTIGLLAVDG